MNQSFVVNQRCGRRPIDASLQALRADEKGQAVFRAVGVVSSGDHRDDRGGKLVEEGEELV